MASSKGKITVEDLHKITIARWINSTIWVVVILITLVNSTDKLLILIIAELIGWFYMDRSFISEVLKTKKSKKS